MSSIRLHHKHGLNPTMPCCFYCGREKGEIALLGAAYREEAPRHMVLDKVPCSWCKENMKRGIVLIEATGKSDDDCRPTGAYAVVTEGAARRIFTEPALTNVLQKRLAFVDRQTWKATGLKESVERRAIEQRGNTSDETH